MHSRTSSRLVRRDAEACLAILIDKGSETGSLTQSSNSRAESDARPQAAAGEQAHAAAGWEEHIPQPHARRELVSQWCHRGVAAHEAALHALTGLGPVHHNMQPRIATCTMEVSPRHTTRAVHTWSTSPHRDRHSHRRASKYHHGPRGSLNTTLQDVQAKRERERYRERERASER